MATHGSMEHREVHFQGMVQGVGFRYTARHLASGFLISGYVRNLSDGRVYLVAEGVASEIDRFLDALRAEMGSYIEGEEQTTGPVTGQYRRFEIRF